MRKGLAWMCGVTMAVLVVLGAFSLGNAAGPAPIEIKFTYAYTNVSLPGRACEYFAQIVNERGKGRVKITTYPTGTLLPADRIYEGVVAGIADMGNTSPHYVATRFPANDSTMLPLPIKSGWAYTHAVHDWMTKFNPKEFQDVHMFLDAGCGPMAVQMRDKPVAKPSDLKGVKIRAAGQQAAEFVKVYGATPVNMPMSEAFEAVSRGVVDGILAPLESLKAWKHADVNKFVTKLPISFAAPDNTFMNLSKWNSLPADIKKLFTDCAVEGREALAKAWWYGDLAGEDYFLAQPGRKFVDIAPADAAQWEKLTAPIKEAYIATHKNLPAAEMIKYLEERMAYYSSRQPDKKVVMDFVDKELMKGAK